MARNGKGVRATVRAAIEHAARLWALAAGLLLLLMTAVTTWNAGAFVLDRLVRPAGLSVAGLPGYEDFVRLLTSCALAMVLPFGQLRRGHVAVDLFTHAMPAPLRGGLARLWLVATALAAAFLGYWMVLGMLETRADGTATSILGWPEWPFYLPGIVSLALWAAVALCQQDRPEETESDLADGAADHGA